jgi:acyl carrier protein
MAKMSREEIVNKIIGMVKLYVPELENAELTEDSVINTDAALDSMGFTLIICRLEAAFDVRIPTRQWQKLSTLGDVVDAIEKRLPKA